MKKLLFFLLLLGLGAAGVAYWMHTSHETAAEAENYTLAPVEHGRLTEVVSATGVVEPREVFPVGTELAGKVVAVLADFNQVVREGDVLLRLDDRMARDRLQEAKLAVAHAEAQRDTAEKALEVQRQRDPEVRRKIDVDLAESHLKAARVAVEEARVKVREAELGLRLTTVRVPVLAPNESAAPAGQPASHPGIGTLAAEGNAPPRKRTFTVLDRKVVLNQQVGPPASAHLFTLASSLDRMQVQALVVEGDINKIRRGQKARFTVSGAADNDHVYHGVVEDVRLVPANERGAVFYKVIVDARNDLVDPRKPHDPVANDWLLRPGLTASVDIVRRAHDHAWKLPTAALNFEPEPASLTDAARAKLARLKDQKGRERWRVIWVVGPDRRPWPVFARVGGRGPHGDTGIQEGQFTEVLEWDAELRPRPDPKVPGTYPQPIIGMPAHKKSGFFNMPSIKL